MNDIKYGRKRSGIKRELIKKVDDWIDSIDDVVVQEMAKKDTIVTGGAIASMLLGEKVNDFDIYFRSIETTEAVAKYYVKKFNERNNLEVGEGVDSCTPCVEIKSLSNVKGETEERVVISIKSAGVASEEQGVYRYFEGETEESTAEFAESLVNEKVAADESSEDKYRPVFMSQNAITLSHKVQLVTRFYGEPKEIHGNYDFIHAMCYWDHGNKAINLPADALEALLSRTLIYKGSLYPVASIFRMKKFIERGWRITAGQQLKIMWQISEIDMTDFEVLQEQLTGVDAAYMWQLTEALKDVDKDKISSTYVASIIDRIFD